MQKVRSPKGFYVGIFNEKNQLIDLIENQTIF